MIKRTLEINIEQARDWYFGDVPALKDLALTLYKEKELNDFEYNSILSELGDSPINMNVNHLDIDNIMFNINLSLLARKFNGNWVKTCNNTGFFIGQRDNKKYCPEEKNLFNRGYFIGKHDTVMYPGIVYFKTTLLAKRALQLLFGKEI